METETGTPASELNAASNASRLARVAAANRETKPTVAKPTAKPRPTAKVAAKVPAKPTVAKPTAKPTTTGRKALTPKERAARPVTATIASYVAWLNREVFGGKLTKAQIEAAGVSITLYGAYQASPERRRARGV